MKFINNSAAEGGGCYLNSYAFFKLEYGATVQFSDNVATYKGGAMFIVEEPYCDPFVLYSLSIFCAKDS